MGSLCRVIRDAATVMRLEVAGPAVAYEGGEVAYQATLIHVGGPESSSVRIDSNLGTFRFGNGQESAPLAVGRTRYATLIHTVVGLGDITLTAVANGDRARPASAQVITEVLADPSTPPSGSRDLFDQPGAQGWTGYGSMAGLCRWNTPLGEGANIINVGMLPPGEMTGTGPIYGGGSYPLAKFTLEEEVIVTTPSAPLRDVYGNGAGWTDGADRCVRGDSLGQFPIKHPSTWGFPWYDAAGKWQGSESKGNLAGAILRAGTIYEMQPLHGCANGYFTAARIRPNPDSITGRGLNGGSHGGSGLPAFFGTITTRQWLQDRAINHVSKAVTQLFMHHASPPPDGVTGGRGFRWPASNADGKGLNGYYEGRAATPHMRSGALLALPLDYNHLALRTHVGRTYAKHLKQWGTYCCDCAGESGGTRTVFASGARGNDQFRPCVAWQDIARVERQFTSLSGGWRHEGRPGAFPSDQFMLDLIDIFPYIGVVANDGPGAWGGPGPRVAPPVPAPA